MSDLEKAYKDRYENILVHLQNPLEEFIESILKSEEEISPRIDQISVRPKGLGSFMAKASTEVEDGSSKYTDPLSQIQDQLGARIVTFFRSDVDLVQEVMGKNFRPIEAKDIIPDSEKEFDYEGFHTIFVIPQDIFTDDLLKNDPPYFFELQIKTLFQHAWAQANHDIFYKAPTQPTTLEIRKAAFTAAQAWGADEIFNQLYKDISTRASQN